MLKVQKSETDHIQNSIVYKHFFNQFNSIIKMHSLHRIAAGRDFGFVPPESFYQEVIDDTLFLYLSLRHHAG